MLEIRTYEPSKCVSEKMWNYRFPWPSKEKYLEDKLRYLALNVETGGLSQNNICEKLVFSVKHAFDTCLKVASKDFGEPVVLREVRKSNLKTSMETCYDSEVFKPNFKIENGREWRFVQININSLADVAKKILAEDSTEEQKGKCVDDWCQYLEGAMVQELAHVLFLEDVVKDENKKAFFVEQMADYPPIDTPINNSERGSRYLTKDIERHGRLLEMDFLSKIYPNSLAEAWLRRDVVESLVTK